MGGQVDRFVVRLVIALTVVSWVSVVGHDLLDREPAESVAPAAASRDASPQPAVVSVPANVTPTEPSLLGALPRP